MLDAFKAMSEGVLSLLGEDSFLRGEPVSYRVNIEHGVQFVGSDDSIVAPRDVATIPAEANAEPGDSLVHPDGAYVLDTLLQDNGVNRRFILRKP